MKTLFLILFALLLNGGARAGGPIEITISTTDAGVAYAMLDPGYRKRMVDPTPEQIETWVRAHPEWDLPDPSVTIYPDDRTSFKTVLDMLRRLKAAGRKKFEVITRESSNGSELRHHFQGSTDNLRSFPDSKPSK